MPSAVALKPGLFDAHYNLGNIHWQQGKLDQAVARLTSDRPAAGLGRGAQ